LAEDKPKRQTIDVSDKVNKAYIAETENKPSKDSRKKQD